MRRESKGRLHGKSAGGNHERGTRGRISGSMLFESLESRELLSAYYISPNGNDSAAGTTTAPWRTLQQAADRVVAGDVVTVRAGNYAGMYMTRDGTADKRITFRGEPGATITSPNSRTGDGINLEGADYVTIEGFKVVGMPRTGIRTVINTGTIIRNNVADRNGVWGVLGGNSDYMLVENNVLSNSIEQHGVYVGSSTGTATVRNNIIFGNAKNGIHLNGSHSWHATNVPGSLIEGNIIYDNGRLAGSGINGDGIANARIQNNLLYNNHASGISLYAIDTKATYGGAKNNLVVNNTIIQAADGRWALNIQDGSTGNTAYNNILYNNHSYNGSIDVSADSLPGLKSDYNVVMDRFDRGDTRVGLAQWRSSTGQDQHSIIATPAQLFANTAINDYHLSASSPAINKGTSLSAPTRDLDGKARPSGSGWDIGAYEYQFATAVVPAAPTNLTAAASGATQINLKWADNSSNETGFRIERRTGTNAFAAIATVGAGVTSYSDSNLTGGTRYEYRIAAVNAAGSSSYTNTAAATTTVAPSTGTGLRAEYFDNVDFTNRKLTRTDATVGFNWGQGSPDATIGPESFSVRWTGQVQPKYSETYTFSTRSDDGVRLWVNGQLLIDNWTRHAVTENSGTITLQAGQKYDIKMEYFENTGNAVAELYWSSASQAKELIPQSQLFAPSSPLA